MKTVHGSANLGVSTDYIGARAHGSLVTISGKARFVEIGGYRIYLGGSFDMIGAGLKYGFDPKVRALEFGASLAIGGSVNITWENMDDVKVEDIESECP